MSNDPDSDGLRQLLKELRQALDRSPAQYTHVAVDKHYVGKLIATAGNIVTAYEEGLADTEELERLRARVESLDGSANYSTVDPTFVA